MKVIQINLVGQKALKKSIKKWERVVASWEEARKHGATYPEYSGRGVYGCGMCEKYMLDTVYEERCNKCPVGLDTGGKYCQLTPYGYYERNTTYRLAKRELSYLKNLESRCEVVKGLRSNRVKEEEHGQA